MSALLQFTDMRTGYGSTTVLRGLSGALEAGSILCVVGRNGVGKTTLMKALFGQLPIWGGTLEFGGVDITKASPIARRRAGMTYCPQEQPVFGELSVKSNLLLTAPSQSLARLAPFMERFPILRKRLPQLAGTLSGGEKKLLSFTRGLSEGQRLVLMDEPSEGVQRENILHMSEMIKERKKSGAAFMIVEQNLAFAELIADSFLVLDRGEVVMAERAAPDSRSRILSHLHI